MARKPELFRLSIPATGKWNMALVMEAFKKRSKTPISWKKQPRTVEDFDTLRRTVGCLRAELDVELCRASGWGQAVSCRSLFPMAIVRSDIAAALCDRIGVDNAFIAPVEFVSAIDSESVDTALRQMPTEGYSGVVFAPRVRVWEAGNEPAQPISNLGILGAWEFRYETEDRSCITATTNGRPSEMLATVEGLELLREIGWNKLMAKPIDMTAKDFRKVKWNLKAKSWPPKDFYK